MCKNEGKPHCSSVVSASFFSSFSALVFFFPFFLAGLSAGSCSVCREIEIVSLVSQFHACTWEMLPDLNGGELVTLAALEALVDGGHGVGRLLPEVQKCGLKCERPHACWCGSAFTSWRAREPPGPVPGRWLGRETGGCSDWPPAGPLSGKRRSWACRSSFWWFGPEPEPDIETK